MWSSDVSGCRPSAAAAWLGRRAQPGSELSESCWLRLASSRQIVQTSHWQPQVTFTAARSRSFNRNEMERQE